MSDLFQPRNRTLTREPVWKVKRMLARMLSGHEIVKQVCIELRARPLVGLGSDTPMRELKPGGRPAP